MKEQKLKCLKLEDYVDNLSKDLAVKGDENTALKEELAVSRSEDPSELSKGI